MGGYKEHKILDMIRRKSVIIKYIVFIVLIFFVTINMISKAVNVTKEEDVVYTGNSNLDYKVYLKENDFFEKSYLEKDKQYIASVIDYIDVNFDYDLVGSIENVDYQYAYKIDAEVLVEDKDTNKALFNSKDELLPEKKLEQNTNTKLEIREKIKIDYNKYNDLIEKFITFYDLNNISSTLTVNMYVKIADENNKSEYNEMNPTMSITIPLTMQTMAIDIETNEIGENVVSLRQKVETKQFLLSAIVLFLIDVVLVIKLCIFIKDTKDEKAIYKMRMKRIMTNYGSYVQKLNNEFDFDGYQILEIKSFEDLLQIRDTINKPILMTEKSDAMETYFFIPSDKSIYIFELKAGRLRKNRMMR